ncbi:AAA family ATPase [Candidatus Gracilibacteria bacterium]|nr:AAA family ATPase [Candidatus Gracilibacteria bacterium]
MSSTLRIRLLGTPEIHAGQIIPPGSLLVKGAALLYYLAATGQAQSRDLLAALLWSDLPEQLARKNLRDVLSNLKFVLGPYLLIARQQVDFNPDMKRDIDVARFVAAIAAAAQAATPDEEAAYLRAAADVYGGTLLEGLYVPDAQSFEEWLQVERERIAQLARQVLHRLCEYTLANGAYLEGMTYATRLVAMDSLNEEAHRHLMRLLVASGQLSAASAQYQSLRQLLRDELGSEPGPETDALYQQLRGSQSRSLAPTNAVPAVVRSHSLPAVPAIFIGRSNEIGQALAALHDPRCRLLTIVGMGGVGKTSLALQVAHALHAEPASEHRRFRHGIFFVSLANIEPTRDTANGQRRDTGSDQRLTTAIADALGLRFSTQESFDTQLLNYVREKQLLLVLDALEHLASAADYCARLLGQASGVSLLATSRSRLYLDTEHVLELNGLAYPEGDARQEDWDSYDAIRMFLHHARSMRPELALDASERAAIGRVCALLNGLPLGIEIATSMARVASFQAIAEGIAANIEYLQASHHALPTRHQSLRAVFDHSWRLLNLEEQRVLCQLSVFRGSFNSAAALQITGATLPLLTVLVDRSLLRRVLPGRATGTEYEMLEIVRQYAAEQVADTLRSYDTPAALHDRHCSFYLAWLQARKSELRSRQQPEVVAALSLRIDNLRSAWAWAVAKGDTALVDAALDGLFFFLRCAAGFTKAPRRSAQRRSALPCCSRNLVGRRAIFFGLNCWPARAGPCSRPGSSKRPRACSNKVWRCSASSTCPLNCPFPGITWRRLLTIAAIISALKPGRRKPWRSASIAATNMGEGSPRRC